MNEKFRKETEIIKKNQSKELHKLKILLKQYSVKNKQAEERTSEHEDRGFWGENKTRERVRGRRWGGRRRGGKEEERKDALETYEKSLSEHYGCSRRLREGVSIKKKFNNCQKKTSQVIENKHLIPGNPKDPYEIWTKKILSKTYYSQTVKTAK
jgi:hypothetical protein